MDKGAAFTVGREVSGGGIFEALDDGLWFGLVGNSLFVCRPIHLSISSLSMRGNPHRFPGTIVADDEGEGGMKLDGLAACVVEGADPGECQYPPEQPHTTIQYKKKKAGRIP